MYPSCYGLKAIELVGDHPVAAGSFADIYKGSSQGQLVCMKVIRIYEASQVDYLLKVFLLPNLTSHCFDVATF